MNNLLQTRFIVLLSEPSQTELTNEVNDAYQNFKTHLIYVCSSDDNAIICLDLNKARVELNHLDTILQCEQGEKCA